MRLPRFDRASVFPTLAAVLLAAPPVLAECPGTWALRADVQVIAACHTFTFTERPAMAFDRQRGVTVFFGGTDDTLGCGQPPKHFQTYEWDGGTWARRATAGEPASRSEAAMAFDSVQNVTVLFGGAISTGGITNQTWVWNGTLWQQRTPPGPPPARRLHDMVFDSARRVVVLFGGLPPGGGGGPSILGDTWEWDGMRWTQRFPLQSPPARYLHAMAYDSNRGITVLFGGSTGAGAAAYNNDTWEWDGVNWMLRTPPASPPARNNHAMAFDEVRGVSVLVAGSVATSPSLPYVADTADTWEWDGNAWTNLPIKGVAPNSGAGGRMVFDSLRPGGGVMVEFGLTHALTASVEGRPYLYELSVPSLSFTQHPEGNVVNEGLPAVFTVAATGSNTLSYQWRKNGVALVDGPGITGSAMASLSIGATTVADSGAYDCIATVAGGCALASRPAALAVAVPPTCPADLSPDGTINTLDLLQLLFRFGQPCPP